MGQADVTRCDVAAVWAVANRFEGTAQLIDGAIQTQLSRVAFDGATAGAAHTAHGDAVHTALNRLSGELSQWTRATLEIATALRATGQRYAEADLHGADRMG